MNLPFRYRLTPISFSPWLPSLLTSTVNIILSGIRLDLLYIIYKEEDQKGLQNYTKDAQTKIIPEMIKTAASFRQTCFLKNLLQQ